MFPTECSACGEPFEDDETIIHTTPDTSNNPVLAYHARCSLKTLTQRPETQTPAG
jgi:hypothetical protein